MDTTRKKHRGIKIAALITVAALAALAILSGTLAKYTTTLDATAQARVARFDVELGDGSGSFDLFDTILDTNPLEPGEETDVRTADEDDPAIVAPGTQGLGKLEVSNNSDVNVTYTVTFEVDDTTIPLEYSLDGGTTWDSDITNLTVSDDLHMGITGVEIDLRWRWPFYVDDATDITDTALGQAATPANTTVTAHVNFTQID